MEYALLRQLFAVRLPLLNPTHPNISVHRVSPWIYYSLAVLMITACGLCWLANLFSLPGNWAIVAIAALFAWLVPGTETQGFAWATVLGLVALAVFGELAEFAAGAVGAAKQGASRRATVLAVVGAMAGSIAGAVVGLPVPIVGPMLAAVLGGAAGAFAGAYIGHLNSGSDHLESAAVGKAALVGRLWGTVGKLAIGGIMLVVVAIDALFV